MDDTGTVTIIQPTAAGRALSTPVSDDRKRTVGNSFSAKKNFKALR